MSEVIIIATLFGCIITLLGVILTIVSIKTSTNVNVICAAIKEMSKDVKGHMRQLHEEHRTHHTETIEILREHTKLLKESASK